MFLKKIISTVSLVALVAVFGAGEVLALTSVGNLEVTAQVVGQKPIVTDVDPATGENSGPTAGVDISGYNFETDPGSTRYVTLDDENSTILTITNVALDSLPNGGDVLTVTVPAGITAGIYNVHVTTSSGTNVSSDDKFTVTDPAPAASATILSINPAGPVVMAGGEQTFTVNISDADSANVGWTANTPGATMTPAADTAAITASYGSFETTFNGATGASYTATFEVEDDAGTAPNPADSETLTIYAIAW